MPDDRPVYIVDLDGTLLSVNSFRVWASFMLRAPFPGLTRRERARVRVVVGGALVLRRMRLIDHDELRSRLQRRWAAATAGDRGAAEHTLQARLMRSVRPELQPLLDAVAGGGVDAILATAAVAEYAECLGACLGFSQVLATPRWGTTGSVANRGTRKRDAVLARMQELGWTDRPMLLLTDHGDDLPLITVSRETYWFGSNGARDELLRDAPGAPRIHPGGRLGDGRPFA